MPGGWSLTVPAWATGVESDGQLVAPALPSPWRCALKQRGGCGSLHLFHLGSDEFVFSPLTCWLLSFSTWRSTGPSGECFAQSVVDSTTNIEITSHLLWLPVAMQSNIQLQIWPLYNNRGQVDRMRWDKFLPLNWAYSIWARWACGAFENKVSIQLLRHNLRLFLDHFENLI